MKIVKFTVNIKDKLLQNILIMLARYTPYIYRVNDELITAFTKIDLSIYAKLRDTIGTLNQFKLAFYYC